MLNRGAALGLFGVVRGHIVIGGLLAFTVGVLLGVAGGGTFSLASVVIFYLVVFLGDLSTHFSNDFFDAEMDGATAKKAKFFSGRRILVKNPQLRPKARAVSMTLMVASVGLATAAVVFGVAPPVALLIAVAANLLGWFYSAPPLRLGSKGLGEMAIALCAGFGIPAFGYLSVRGQLDLLFAVFAVPFMLYAFMLALSLEAPDIDVDRRFRRNIGVRLGKNAVYGFMLATAFSAFACFVFYSAFLGGYGINFLAAAAFAAVPLAAGAVGLICVFLKRFGDVFGTVNVMALFAFNVMLIVYLLMVVL